MTIKKNSKICKMYLRKGLKNDETRKFDPTGGLFRWSEHREYPFYLDVTKTGWDENLNLPVWFFVLADNNYSCIPPFNERDMTFNHVGVYLDWLEPDCEEFFENH